MIRWPLITPEAVPPCTAGLAVKLAKVLVAGLYDHVVSETLSMKAVP
jgi:hypothetical protein